MKVLSCALLLFFSLTSQAASKYICYHYTAAMTENAEVDCWKTSNTDLSTKNDWSCDKYTEEAYAQALLNETPNCTVP